MGELKESGREKRKLRESRIKIDGRSQKDEQGRVQHCMLAARRTNTPPRDDATPLPRAGEALSRHATRIGTRRRMKEKLARAQKLGKDPVRGWTKVCEGRRGKKSS